MKFRFAVSALLTVTSSAFFLVATPKVKAQGSGQPQVSVVNLQAVKNSTGGTSVVTPKGDLAPLPGAGVNGNVAQIYIGANGGFWYTDKTGQTVDLHQAVQQLMAKRAQQQKANQVPQYAPMATSQPQQTQQQSSSGSSGLQTAAAAGLGAMAGSAMTHAFYNVPYGTPMYYGPGGRPYYYNNGERVELNDNQKAVLYNQRATKNQQKQQAYQQAQTNRQTRNQQTQQAYQQAQTNRQTRYQQRQSNIQNRQQAYGQQQSTAGSRFGNNQVVHNNYQQQQKWYQQQLNQNKDRASKWKQQTNNPFVNQNHSGGRFSQAGNSSRRGRFSQAGNSGSRGSRFEGLKNRQRPTRSRGGRAGRFGR